MEFLTLNQCRSEDLLFGTITVYEIKDSHWLLSTISKHTWLCIFIRNIHRWETEMKPISKQLWPCFAVWTDIMTFYITCLLNRKYIETLDPELPTNTIQKNDLKQNPKWIALAQIKGTYCELLIWAVGWQEQDQYHTFQWTAQAIQVIISKSNLTPKNLFFNNGPHAV